MRHLIYHKCLHIKLTCDSFVHIKAILRKIEASASTQAAVWAHNHSSGLTNAVHDPIANGSSGDAVTIASKAQHRAKGDA